jgi:hypothetical protein
MCEGEAAGCCNARAHHDGHCAHERLEGRKCNHYPMYYVLKSCFRDQAGILKGLSHVSLDSSRGVNGLAHDTSTERRKRVRVLTPQEKELLERATDPAEVLDRNELKRRDCGVGGS